MEELKNVADELAAIKEGLEKVEEHHERLNKLDEVIAERKAAPVPQNDSVRAGKQALGRGIAQAFAKFAGKSDYTRDFDESNSGVVVPTPTFPGLVRLLEEGSLPRQICRVLPMTSATLVVPTVTAITTGAWVGEGASVGSDSTTTFGSKADGTLTAEACAVLGKISKELDQDSIVAMQEVLGGIYADALATAENEAFLVHDGTTSGQPFTGLFEDANIAASPIDTAAGTASDTMAEVLTYGNLVNCLTDLPSQHQSRASWIMSPTVWAEILKIEDNDGRPLINASAFADSASLRLLGRPVFLNDSAPAFNATTSADQAFVICGDIPTGCIMGARQGVEVEFSDVIFMQTRENALLVSERVAFKTVLPAALRKLSTDVSA